MQEQPVKTAKTLPENQNQTYAPLPEEVEKLKAELTPEARSHVIYFGAEAQAKLDEISSKMIEGVQNKEIGPAGEDLNRMVSAIRGFDIDALNPNRRLSWWQKLLGKAEPLAEFIQRYEEVKSQIDTIAEDLERRKATLQRDLVALDKLYEANLEYFKSLETYIAAGEARLKELEEKELPEQQKKAESGDMLEVQALRELREFRDDLERRVHDLRLSRQVAMQALPSIRLIQENDKALINKINSTLVNTVPLWRNQLAQTVTIFRSHDAAKALKNAGDLTNELLEKNAEGLREANREVRTQMERGVFEIESIKKANATLIATLNDSLQIAEEGKKARAEALRELQQTEAQLKEALVRIQAKKTKTDLPPPREDQSA
ncbi:MAG: toxic anion resistance protein [Epsilonproteobacteria bacterium]|nr:toxic anion resistance protein [Campylobacterota bacterium]